jgi:hypothetical protein
MWKAGFRATLMALSAAAACIFLTGCNLTGWGVTSVHPLYGTSDSVVEPAILGYWSPADDKTETWKFFLRPDGQSYTAIYRSEGVPAKLIAHLVRLGDQLYMDTFPEVAQAESKKSQLNNPVFTLHLVACHVFWRIHVTGDVLKMAPLDRDHLEKALDDRTVSIAHEVQEPESDGALPTIILTAPTESLQEFVRTAGDKVFLAEPEELHRKGLTHH